MWKEHEIEEAYVLGFGLWINTNWEFVCDFKSELGLEEKRTAFLLLLTQLLEDDKIVLFVPLDTHSDPVSRKTKSQAGCDVIWDIRYEEMMAYFRRSWPATITDEHDTEFGVYLYSAECPEIGWIHSEDGRIVAS